MTALVSVMWLIIGILISVDVIEISKWQTASYAFLLALVFFILHITSK